jgi:hypothetical protein
MAGATSETAWTVMGIQLPLKTLSDDCWISNADSGLVKENGSGREWNLLALEATSEAKALGSFVCLTSIPAFAGGP